MALCEQYTLEGLSTQGTVFYMVYSWVAMSLCCVESGKFLRRLQGIFPIINEST